MLKAVVGRLGPRPHHLSGVIETSDQTPFVKIKDLLPGVGGNTGWEVHLQTSPPLPMLLPGLDFSEFEIWQRQAEGCAQVIAQSITGEVEKIRAGPSRSCGADLGTTPAGLCAPAVGSRPRSQSKPCPARTPHIRLDLDTEKKLSWAWNTRHGPRPRRARRASISLRRGNLPSTSSPKSCSNSANAPFHHAPRSRGQEVRSSSALSNSGSAACLQLGVLGGTIRKRQTKETPPPKYKSVPKQEKERRGFKAPFFS